MLLFKGVLFTNGKPQTKKKTCWKRKNKSTKKKKLDLKIITHLYMLKPHSEIRSFSRPESVSFTANLGHCVLRPTLFTQLYAVRSHVMG